MMYQTNYFELPLLMSIKFGSIFTNGIEPFNLLVLLTNE